MEVVAPALLVAALLLALSAVPSSAEHEGSTFLALPLDIEIRFPPDGAAFNEPNLTAVVEAEGESVAFFDDDFANGSFVNTDLDAGGVGPNASGPGAQSHYTSPVFELPNDSPRVEWSTTLEITTSGSSANLTTLLALEVRFGDRDAARNWSAWIPATVDGVFGDPRGPGNESLREKRALEYRITFPEPTNASTPRVVSVQIWYLAHITHVEGYITGSLANNESTNLSSTGGRYNYSVVLDVGVSLLGARVVDALGNEKSAHVLVTYDPTAPAISSAPPNGTSIPADDAAVIRFSEPINRTSASGQITVQADFPVDLVWSADNTTLFVSAQEAGQRGPVTIVVGAGLEDRAGNELGQAAAFTYEMGRPAEVAGDTTPLLAALFALVALAAVAVLYLSGRAKRQKEAYAEAVRREMDGKPPEPPGAP